MDRPVGLISRPFWRGPVTLQSKWDLRTVGGILVAIILLTVIGWLYLDQAAMIAEAESDIAELENRRDDLLREYRYLQGQLAAATAVESAMAQADSMNLHMARQIDILVVPRVDQQMYGEGASQGAVAYAEQSANEDGPAWLWSMAGWLENWFSPRPSTG